MANVRIEGAFFAAIVASLAGLALSVTIERLMMPRPSLVRPWPAWALHCGLWFLSHAFLLLLLGRPWFATVAVLAFLLMLVFVNNAKFRALREPFVFQDYEYFTDAIRHPRLYIPFLGWWKFFGVAAGFLLAVAVGLWGEVAPAQRFAWFGQLGAIAVISLAGIVLLLAGNWSGRAGSAGSAGSAGYPGRPRLSVCFDPVRDLRHLGFLSFLWRYAQAENLPPIITSPFDFLPAGQHSGPFGNLPHLVAVQSESFFDPRFLYQGIRTEVLAEFDRLKADAVAHGQLKVPAWGANTVRTEFAFLSGIDEDRLGVHRFNPYRAIAAGWPVSSLASYLKRLGYRTICIHPYPASFYRRDCVYPRLGFDAFLDIRAFGNAPRFGPYVADVAVADKVAALLGETRVPVFVFVITMENHGPLHLEKANAADIDALYAMPPPKGCDDLTIYLRHLRNADAMIAKLRQTLDRSERAASLCWFGDHVPILPAVYEKFGVPSGAVEYVFWNNRNRMPPRCDNLVANELSTHWLRAVDLVNRC